MSVISNSRSMQTSHKDRMRANATFATAKDGSRDGTESRGARRFASWEQLRSDLEPALQQTSDPEADSRLSSSSSLDDAGGLAWNRSRGSSSLCENQFGASGSPARDVTHRPNIVFTHCRWMLSMRTVTDRVCRGSDGLVKPRMSNMRRSEQCSTGNSRRDSSELRSQNPHTQPSSTWALVQCEFKFLLSFASDEP